MYEEGQILNLLTANPSAPIKARIVKLLKPWTLSAVMAVDVLHGPPGVEVPNRVFLKLYDRRYSEQSRSDWRIANWTPDTDRRLAEFSRSGEAREFLKKWRQDPDFGKNDDDWGIGENEASLSDYMRELSQTESKVYRSLFRHQGRLIPRLYAEVVLHVGPGDGDLGGSPEVFDIPGILIEYVEGFRMSDLARRTDESEWNYLVNRAVDATGDILNDSDVLNRDVRPDNMMVCRDEAWERGYRLVMIDFGHCRFRKDGETIEEWGLEKHRQDEEGAMGEVMKIKLREQVGFEADCRRRLSWIEYAEGDGTI